VKKPSELGPAIAAARAHPGPAVIEFCVFREENVFPMVPSGASLSEVIPDTAYVPAPIATPIPASTPAAPLRIPPEIPADAPRAGPLLSTASAQATPVRLARHARRTELRSLVEAVQAAHEETFELTPIGLEAAPARSQKPQVYAQVKPTREAPSEPHETKVA
jgi:hypothetical protein